MPKNIKPIRDIVHNYIYVTPIEEIMIDNPKFQRLRHISQNSLAYLTYPSNGINRFTHSLGVMHNGGRMFKKSLENSDCSTLTKFINSAEKLINFFIEDSNEFTDKKLRDIEKIWTKHFGNISGFNHLPNNLSEVEKKNLDSREIFIVNVLWQSIRIGCVLHDVGHYPLSHLFESAIKKYSSEESTDEKDVIYNYSKALKNDYEKDCKILKTLSGSDLNFSNSSLPPHEMKGVSLLRSFYPNQNDEIHLLSLLCSSIGKAIFIVNKDIKTIDTNGYLQELRKKEEFKVLLCLHTIISSEIDADRLDYCVRDAICSGTELGAIDVERIVNALKLIEKDNDFLVVLTNSSLSGVEEFFHQRYLLYKYIIYHHNVSRLNGVLEEILKRIFVFSNDLAKNNKTPISDILRKFHLMSEHNQFMNEFPFEFYDDCWLKAMISEIYYGLMNRTDLPNDYAGLLLLIEIFLHRQLPYISSMWKRESDIMLSVEKIVVKLTKKRYFTSKFTERDKERDVISKINALFKTKKKSIITEIRKKLDQLDVILIYSECNPKIFSEDEKEALKIEMKNGVLKSAHEISYYISSLKDIALNTIIPRFAFVNKKIRTKGSTINLLDVCIENTENIIIENLLSLKNLTKKNVATKKASPKPKR